MKKNFLLLFWFISMITFSQEYHFDYFITEHSSRFKPDNQQWVTECFYDSVHKKKLFIIGQNNKMIASIYEKENNRRHVFTVKKSKDKTTFVYKHSNQYPQQQSRKDYNRENMIQVQRLDSLKYNVTVFKNSKFKKKKISAIVTLEKSEFDYINFTADYNRTDEINEKIKSLLNPKFNYIISNQQKKYNSSDYIFEESIQKIQKTDLTIVVPKNLVMTEYSYWSDFED